MEGDLLRWRHLFEIGNAVAAWGGFRSTRCGAVAATTAIRFGCLRFRAGGRRRDADHFAVTAVAHDVRLQFHVVFQRSQRFHPEFLQDAVIRFDRLFRINLPIGDPAQKMDERELVFRILRRARRSTSRSHRRRRRRRGGHVHRHARRRAQ